jgi:hypothetical protein
MVAIKRLDEHATIFDFKSELQLAKLQHINLVRLLGWCIHGKERILVYTLIQNGSLDRYLSGTFSLTGVNFLARFISLVLPPFQSRCPFSLSIFCQYTSDATLVIVFQGAFLELGCLVI